MRFRLSCLAMLAAFALPSMAQTLPALTLEEALARAAEQSRGLEARRFQAQSAREMAVMVGQRPDPRLSLALSNVPVDGPQRGSLTSEPMTMRSIGLMQTLTRADKLDAHRERAMREADLAGADAQVDLAALQRDAALAWLDRSLQQSRIVLLRAQRDEAERQAQAVEAVYRSGGGAQADVFAARANLERVDDRIDQATRDADIARVQLARWVGDAAARPVAERPAFVLPAWTTRPLVQALLVHPQVEAAARLRSLAEADTVVADVNRKSDWSVEVMYSQRGPSFSNMVSVNLSVPLQWDAPLRQDRELAARQAMVERAKAMRDDRLRAVEAEVAAALEAWRSHQRRLQRFDDPLLPLARQRRDAALSAYRAGSGTLAEVLAARSAEIDVELDRLALQIDIARVWAQLHTMLPESARTAP